MFVTEEQKTEIEDEIIRCLEVAKQRWPQHAEAFKLPVIKFNLFNATAGIAQYRTWTIRLNPILLRENGAKFINRTVPHEIAHLVDFHLQANDRSHQFRFNLRGRKKRSVHGPSWQHVMDQFGVEPSTYHSYDIANTTARRKRYTYNCPSCQKPSLAGPKIHRSIQLDSKRYSTKCCKSVIGRTDWVDHTACKDS